MGLLVERRELLLRFRAGDRSALEEVYRHYAPSVTAFLQRGFSFQSAGRTLRFTGYTHPFDVDNVLQETFTRAFRESARLAYDGIHPYKGYVLAIARNLVLDDLRSRELARGLVESEDDPVGPEAPASAEHQLLAGELAGLYGRFVERLGERDRGFFRARFEDQRTQVEAGRVNGLSHMQARTLEKKLRKRFLAFMHASGYLETYGGGA